MDKFPKLDKISDPYDIIKVKNTGYFIKMKGEYTLGKIRKILLMLMFMTGINIYSFDGQNVIYKRVLDEHNPDSKNMKIELRENDMTFIGKKGNGTVIFSDNKIENIIIKHRVRTNEDIMIMENFINNIMYFTNGDRELVKGRISDDTAREYELDISSRLSGKGITTKIIDVITLNRFRGILTDDRREKEIKITLTRKQRKIQ
ncbi:MAG: hypothetical protein Q4D53_08045 [Leptotrichiaceae bacterium]|nr:hypothetical protein [Leptotrichiaceae bacterium]